MAPALVRAGASGVVLKTVLTIREAKVASASYGWNDAIWRRFGT